MILYLYLISIVQAAINCDKNHTDIYLATPKNQLSSLYLNYTYGGRLFGIDPCKKFTARKEYINTLLNLGLKCNGTWCREGKYDCVYENNNCYQVEHIVDLSNSNNNCSKNIYGNLIMAYGVWNQQVGRLNWNHVKNEKKRNLSKYF